MAALRGRGVSGCLRTNFFKQINTASISALPTTSTRNGYFEQRSHLHTVRRSGPLIQTLLGCHNHGRMLLVSAVAVRHNSSQTAGETVPAINPAAGLTSAPMSVPVADPTPVVTQPVTEQLAEAPVMAMDVLQGAGTELSLAELGLGSYTPVGLVQNILEYMHVTVGLPWWGAIVAGTIMARCAVFPLIIKGQRETVKTNNVLPELTKLTNRMNEAKQSDNKFEYSKAYSDLMLFQKKHDVNPLRGFLVPMVQAPVFISFFIALRKMAELPVPSLQTGGVGWFPDLSIADPYFILPFAVTGTMFAILELGVEAGVGNPNMRVMKNVFRIMPFAILPMTINFPTAVFTYWLTSNLFSLGQVALLKHPAIRKFFRIPVSIVHPPSALPSNEGLIKSFKKGWKDVQVAHQLEERERRIKGHLDIASKGPLRQTFTHNPLQQTSAPMSTVTTKKQQPTSEKKRPWEETIG
ncbi:mitochondrial inner membrane protein OXA1L [Salminus brasiliensis]|uniref:mitochondrial inner membrane protein OXA1L n=1 Tax=Salminus brasiliensis TaxID=930266 RepID=UPI003B833670